MMTFSVTFKGHSLKLAKRGVRLDVRIYCFCNRELITECNGLGESVIDSALLLGLK